MLKDILWFGGGLALFGRRNYNRSSRARQNAVSGLIYDSLTPAQQAEADHKARDYAALITRSRIEERRRSRAAKSA